MTTEESINKLKEDYFLRSMLKKRNLSVHDELEDEIDDLEQSYITSIIMPKLEAYAQDLLKDLECELYLAVLKDANGDVRVENEYVSDLMGEPVKPQMVMQDGNAQGAILITPANINDIQGRNLRVTIGDVVFEEKNSIQTFIKVLKHIGLDKIPSVGITVKGYNLVDKAQRTDGRGRWQQYVDGWWVYVYFSNTTKVMYLLQIANHYNIKMKIEAI